MLRFFEKKKNIFPFSPVKQITPTLPEAPTRFRTTTREAVVQPLMASLRGGKNIYGPKTLIGPWVEGGKRTYVTPTNSISGFVTSAVDQQLDTQKEPPPRFGRSLPPAEDDRYDFSNIINPDTYIPPEAYESVTEAVHRPPSDPTENEFNATKHKLGGMNKADLAAYRKDWTRESKMAQDQRWRTTTNSSQMSTSKLTRALPGAPLSYDTLVEKLSANGAANSTALKGKVPGSSSMMNYSEFKAAVVGCGVDMLDPQLRQVFDFFDQTEAGVICIDGIFGT